MSKDSVRRVLDAGRNCWRIERAHRLCLIVDAADYFKAVKEAILAARYTVYLIGWDFDTRIKFEPEPKSLEGPNKLGSFLRWIDKSRPGLDIYVLQWDLGGLQTIVRGTTPLSVLNWVTSRRIHFKLDGAHPNGAAHHQKIVVVDDALAFCGGIDITAERWDTREHRDRDERRKRPSGRSYGPWHDVTTAVDGEVARALGELSRDRWRRATGEDLKAPPTVDTRWPKSVRPTFTEVDVAIARTVPEYQDHDEVREIEAFYLDAIASAERSIYCESQYFASRRIAEAIAKRLKERNGPDIVIVNPESASGFLEAATMDTARARLLKLVKAADRHDRFRIFTPVTKNREPIYVHSKILIVDNRLLRIGSSNLNNRSMGFDTECDLIVEAVPRRKGAPEMRERLASIQNDLLAEHLDVACGMVEKAVSAADGSLAKAIDCLLSQGRSLVPYVPDKISGIEDALAENDLFDPEQPPSLTKALFSRLGLQYVVWR